MGIFLDILRWLIADPLGLLFLMCVLGNWGLLIAVALRCLRSTSLILPFLGPLFGIVFFLAVPIDGFWCHWWLAPLLEPTWLLGAGLLVTWMFVPRKSPVKTDS